VESPLVRGGLTIGAGLIAGNIIGFVRVALTAYLLGTHSQADSLAVAVGPLDALNSVLINTMVFAFVPMLTERQGADRTALFLKLNQWFAWLFSLLTLAIVVSAPWLIAVLAPGLDPRYYRTSVTILRISAFSIMAAGAAAINCALLYTDRRFAPFAFYQACLNVFTIAGALSLWRVTGRLWVRHRLHGGRVGAICRSPFLCPCRSGYPEPAALPRCIGAKFSAGLWWSRFMPSA
jgi:putative peptidoglycan lipid II flippase